MLRNNADARRCSYFELGLPVIIHENVPWSSAAKSMLPGRKKYSMTSVRTPRDIFIDGTSDLLLAKTTHGARA